MEPREISRAFAFLRRTPFHPQWLIFLGESRRLARLASGLDGTILDLGCADGRIRGFLAPRCSYIGLDYYRTATGWYGTRPDIFGDAQAIPVADTSVDYVLLLDVLEHLPRPDDCVREVRRVLRTGGKLIIQVPFLYPVHDSPLDFQRWTVHGLRVLSKRHGFVIVEEICRGTPLESAALLANIAIAKTVLGWLNQKNPLLLLGILLPIAILLINLSSWMLARFVPHDVFMAHGLRMTWAKE